MLWVAFIFEQIGTKRDVRLPGNAHTHTLAEIQDAHTHTHTDTDTSHRYNVWPTN